MAISFTELLHGHVVTDLSINEQHNLEDLQRRINIIRAAWGKPMTVTSGFRTEQDQLRINPKAPNSKHRIGCAVDIADDGSLKAWLKGDGAKYLDQADLYCEEGTVGWCHFQSRPFGSYQAGGTRWFKP